MHKRYYILLVLLTFSVSAQDYSGYAGSFLSMGPDARSVALGNALIAGTESVYPAYFNPAEVAAVKNKKILFTHQFLTLDRSSSILSFSTPLPPVGGISVGWIRAGVKDIEGRDLSGIHTGNYSAAENAFLISFGIVPLQRLKIGGTVKILKNQLPNIDGNISGNGVGFDFGISYSINNDFNYAIAVKNINSAYRWSNKLTDELGRVYKDKFPMQIRTGMQYTTNYFIFVSDIGSYIYNGDILGYDFGLGVEYTYHDNYFIRGGYGNSGFAGGVGLKYAQFNRLLSFVDYSFVFEKIAGLTHVISYAVNF